MKGTTPTAFVKDILHLSTSKVTAWKNGSIPKSEILIQISDYFGVSVSYLFDGDTYAYSHELTEVEQRLLTAFRQLSKDDKMAEIGRMKLMAEKYTELPVEKGA